MPRSLVFFHTLVAISALLIAAVGASAQSPRRITRVIEDSERAVVAGAHPMARAEFDKGRLDANVAITRAAIVFKLSASQQRALDQLLAEQQELDSPNYHKWLTPEQYAERFGMNNDDLTKVTAWLRSQGLTVDGYSRARTRVFFSGTVGQVSRAFNTEFHNYVVDGATRFANATGISVPAAFSGMVLGFRGFDNFRPKPRAHAARPNYTSHQTGAHYVAPGDFATIYDVQALYDSGLDGTGETIAVAGQTEIHTADIDAFRAAAGLPPTNLQLVAIPNGGSGSDNEDEVEADLDVEWSGGVAKNATILYVYAGANSTTADVFTAFEYAIDQKLAPVISISYGNCELILGPVAQTFQQDVQQGNLQGQTTIAASGDSGAADCDPSSSPAATHGIAVDVPADIPEVTGVGGSEFTGDANGTVSGGNAGSTTYWSGTTNGVDNLNSALSYIPEMAWNDTAVEGGLAASGGGVSTLFSKPTWQTAHTPADGQRDIPDISLTASPNHDAVLICSQALVAGSCSSGFQASNGTFGAIGGTSDAAPAFAGILAILNQATKSGGLGNINTHLYSLAGSAAFHDITAGNNIVPCTAGSTGCSGSHTIGFSAGAGYDLVTGLGSVNAHTLVASWPGVTLTPDFSVGGTPATVSAPGQSGTSNITVTAVNGFSGTVDLACMNSSLPTGASCAFVPGTVSAGSAPGTSVLTISTSSATPTGSFTIIVTGTSGAVSHNASVHLSIRVSTTPNPDFSVSVGPLSPPAFSPGGSATSTITIVPSNGFAASVGLVCSVTGSGTPLPTCSLNPSSVASGSGTSTLTLNTTAPGGANAGTPPGIYSVMIVATSGSLTHSQSIPFTVQGPVVPDFQISASALSPGMVTRGASATSTITIIPTGGFTASVSLSCSVTGSGPPLPTCSFNPGVVASGSGTSMLTVSTTAAHASLSPRSNGLVYALFLPVGLALLTVNLRSRRRKLLSLLVIGLMLSGLVLLAACGGGKSSSSSNAGSSGGTQPGTPPGPYTITVTGTSGQLTHSTIVTLNL